MTTPQPTPAPDDGLARRIAHMEAVLGMPFEEAVPLLGDAATLVDIAWKCGRESGLALAGAQL